MESAATTDFVFQNKNVKISQGLLKSLQVSKVFSDIQNDGEDDRRSKVSAIDFHDNDELLFCSTFSGIVYIYSLLTAQLMRKQTTATGIDMMKTLKGDSKSILIVSNNRNSSVSLQNKDSYACAVRYWNLDENVFVRIFLLPAPWSYENCLSSHPTKDLFLISIKDFKIRVFDLHREDPIYVIDSSVDKSSSPSFPLAVFDFEGFVFACHFSNFIIKLFSCENTNDFYNEEFASFNLSSTINPSTAKITNLLFSPDGKSLLISTDSSQIFCLDAFDGSVKAAYHNCLHMASSQILDNLDISFSIPSFTPCAKFVLCGSSDNLIRIWTIEGEYVTKLQGHTVFPKFVSFHKRKALMISVSNSVVLWQPPKF